MLSEMNSQEHRVKQMLNMSINRAQHAFILKVWWGLGLQITPRSARGA